VLRWALRLHKWLALIVAVQVLFWVGGGLVMTLMPIERVRGEHRLVEPRPAALPLDRAVPPGVVAAKAGRPLAELMLMGGARGPIWMAHTTDGRAIVFDALTGVRLPPLDEAGARRAAAAAYRGPGRVMSAERLSRAPQETRKEGPLWRVDFDDPEGTTFYVAPDTGEVVSRRSDMWRVYDFMWRLHILDFRTGDNFNHPLLVGLAALTLVVTLTGYVLLWIRLRKDLRPARRNEEPGAP
jgi:uncharacterized iron-regulated membrane protein